jgi:hypothetical protein
MVSVDQIRNLIYHTCWEMGDNFGSDEAVQLILETGVIESNYKFIRQLGDGPARSFWQIEPATAVDNCQHYLKHRRAYLLKCAEASMVDVKWWQLYSEPLWSAILEKNLAAAIIHCRLKYWRVPKRMPNTLEGRARYWKTYYNTEQGAGTVEKYIETIKGMRDIL